MIVLTFGSPQYRTKMASFDYDWTLVRPKTGNTFYKDKEDWTYLFDNIKEVLQKYYDEGYMIVIFTNQTKEWKKEQILHVMNKLDVPLFVPLGNIVLNSMAWFQEYCKQVHHLYIYYRMQHWDYNPNEASLHLNHQ